MAYVNPDRDHDYYSFSSTENSTRHRMVVELLFDGLDYEEHICRGSFVLPPEVPIPGKVLKLRKAPEDMPWCGEAIIVSERLKQLLLRFEPDMLDFVPTVLTYEGEPWTEVQYSLINTRRIVECHDPDISVVKPDVGGKDPVQVSHFTFAERPLPDGAHLARVKYFYVSLVVSDEVRRAMEAEGLTGCCFFSPNQGYNEHYLEIEDALRHKLPHTYCYVLHNFSDWPTPYARVEYKDADGTTQVARMHPPFTITKDKPGDITVIEVIRQAKAEGRTFPPSMLQVATCEDGEAIFAHFSKDKRDGEIWLRPAPNTTAPDKAGLCYITHSMFGLREMVVPGSL